MDFLGWLKQAWTDATVSGSASQSMSKASTLTELEGIWAALTPSQQADTYLSLMYQGRKKEFADIEKGLTDPLEVFMTDALTEWLKTIKQYETKDPEVAKANLVKLTGDVMKIAGTTAAIDLALGMLPNDAGTVSVNNTKEIMKWLGFGAVITAVAHDPVKIGLLRPYQDSLEQTFRNRRPDDNALFQAYRTRELAPEKVEDLSLLDDAVMTRIETDNDRIYNQEISRWGYDKDFSLALQRSATRTLSFADLRALANVGYYDRGLSIYSLWGYGLDRVTMKPALDGLQVMRDRQMYSGFRSMIEPSYIDGFLSEKDLTDYWTKSGIPLDVQTWILPRMRARREAAEAKATGETVIKEKDLTVSTLQLAYQDELIDRAKATAAIISLGYSKEEADILLNIAELRRKTPSAAKLKKLTLTDYEKAYKNKIITLDQVLERMKGEYATPDIEIERQLLIMGKA